MGIGRSQKPLPLKVVWIVLVSGTFTAAARSLPGRHRTHSEDDLAHSGSSTYLSAVPSTVMIATAFSSSPCESALGNYVNLLSLKNKQDYAKMHNYGLYWGVEQMDASLEGPWNKVAVLSHLAHTLDPRQFEWILWLDYDLLIHDINFTIPFDRYAGRDLVISLTPDKVFESADALAINSGVVLLRNTKWTRSFLKALSDLGRDWWKINDQSPHLQHLKDGVTNFHAALYEQNGIVYLLKHNTEWQAKVFAETSDVYYFHQMFLWLPGVNFTREEGKPLFAVHWAGCQFCTPKWSTYDFRYCVESFVKVFAKGDESAMASLNEGKPVAIDLILPSILALLPNDAGEAKRALASEHDGDRKVPARMAAEDGLRGRMALESHEHMGVHGTAAWNRWQIWLCLTRC